MPSKKHSNNNSNNHHPSKVGKIKSNKPPLSDLSIVTELFENARRSVLNSPICESLLVCKRVAKKLQVMYPSDSNSPSHAQIQFFYLKFLCQYAKLLDVSKDYEVAKQTLHQCCDIVTSLVAPPLKLVADIYCYLGLVYKNLHNLQRCEENFRLCIACCGELLGKVDDVEDGVADDWSVDEADQSRNAMNAGLISQYNLALLLCQSPERERQLDANWLLKALGYNIRLAPELMAYSLIKQSSPTMSGSNNPASRPLIPRHPCPYITVYDHILSSTLLETLSGKAFIWTSQFWSHHQYPTPSFFSYHYSLSEKPMTVVEQLIQVLYPLVQSKCPNGKTIRGAEWWVHSREFDDAHQLHYDTDETRLLQSGIIHYPLLSSILYLSEGGIGGPTLITNQRIQDDVNNVTKGLSDGYSSEGYLVFPSVNRYCLFDGSMLHGVIPGIASPPSPLSPSCGRRITLMIGWWEVDFTPSTVSMSLGPNMLPPWRHPSSSRLKMTGMDTGRRSHGRKKHKSLTHHTQHAQPSPWWTPCLEPITTLSLNEYKNEVVLDTYCKNVWVPVVTEESRSKSNPYPILPPSTDLSFCGRFFLVDFNSIKDEMMIPYIHRQRELSNVSDDDDEGEYMTMEQLRALRGET